MYMYTCIATEQTEGDAEEEGEGSKVTGKTKKVLLLKRQCGTSSYANQMLL